MATEGKLSREGTELVYSISGNGPPLVFGHSLFCKRSMWDGVIAVLESDFTCINVGLRGHGESSATAPFSVWDLADDWLAVLDQEKIEKATLVGLSTGGMTAMRFAVRYPERVTGLALIDSDAGPETRRWNRFQYAALGALYRHTGIIPLKTLSKAMFGPETIASNRGLVDELIAIMRTFDRKQLGRAMKAVFGRDGVDVSGLTVPTLVVVGEHDEATPPSRSRAIASAIAGAQFEMLPGAGHLTALEQPAMIARLLGEFLPTCVASE